MADILRRLRNPPFGTETSERNLMAEAADEIERLRGAPTLREIIAAEIKIGDPYETADRIIAAIAKWES